MSSKLFDLEVHQGPFLRQKKDMYKKYPGLWFPDAVQLLPTEITDPNISFLQVRARELQDNIKFVENEGKISKLDENINEMREEQERVGDIDKLRRCVDSH